MINKPSKKPNFKEEESELKDIIKKFMEIMEILTTDSFTDKRLNKQIILYLSEFIDIILTIEKEDINYSDEFIIKRINCLYNKIFKKRRY